MTADSCRHVEHDCRFNPFHCSHFRWPETGRPGECRPASATVRVQTWRSANKTDRSRSNILDRSADDLAGLEISIGNRAAGDGDFVAPQALQTVLVEVIPTQTTWPSADPFGDPEAVHGEFQIFVEI